MQTDDETLYYCTTQCGVGIRKPIPQSKLPHQKDYRKTQPGTNKIVTIMFAIRTASAHNTIRRITTTQRLCWQSSSYFSTSSDEHLTGMVKFFIRKSAYGFLIPDDPAAAGASEIWVHRTSFESPHSTDEFPTRPYLYKNERVKFRIEIDEQGRTPKATGLTFENGKLVPLFRKNYHLATIKGEEQRLGEFLLEVMKEEGLSDEERMEKITTAVTATEEAIALADRNQHLYGPDED
jgi:cold shock CspA family protein